MFLAIGLAAHEESFAAGVIGAVAFLYHPPTVYPFWIAYTLLALQPDEPRLMRTRQQGLIPLAVALGVLLLLAKVNHGATEPQVFFAQIDGQQEALELDIAIP